MKRAIGPNTLLDYEFMKSDDRKAIENCKREKKI